MIRGQELRRTARPDGMTEILVALGVDRQGTLVVPTYIVDGEGYQAMLDAYATNHANLVALREGEQPS